MTPEQLAHQRVHRTLTRALSSSAARVWSATAVLGQDEEATTERTLSLVLPGLATAAATASSWLGGRAPARVDYGRVRNGVEPHEVYTRPFKLWVVLLGKGLAPAQARSEAVRRVETLVRTDAQKAYQVTALDTMQEQGVETYRRVVGGQPCPLCVAAAGDVYRSDELMPVHAGCSCGVTTDMSTAALPESHPDPAETAVNWTEETGPELVYASHETSRGA